MRGARLTVCVDMNDHITLLYKDKTLPYTVHEKQKKVSKVATEKEINRLVDSLKTDGRTRGHKPSANHPWRQYSNSTSQARQAAIAGAPLRFQFLTCSLPYDLT